MVLRATGGLPLPTISEVSFMFVKSKKLAISRKFEKQELAKAFMLVGSGLELWLFIVY